MIFYQLLPGILPWFTFHSAETVSGNGGITKDSAFTFDVTRSPSGKLACRLFVTTDIVRALGQYQVAEWCRGMARGGAGQSD